MRFPTLATPFAASLLLSTSVSASKLYSRQGNSSTSQQRADAVKQTFQIAWNGYSTYAFPNDELHPVSNSFSNSRNGWGASAVDAFSTALVMEIPEIVVQILEYIPTINFNETNEQVSLFETTIRYMAGMLSGYDLLKGPLAHLNSNDTATDALLTQAKNLADILKFAFDTPTGVPSNNLNITAQVTDGSTDNGLAQIGTLVLEWTRLSDLTGDDTYAALAQKGQSYLLNPMYTAPYAEPWPGLEGTNVNLTTGLFEDASGGWTGGDDSFYEYLIKMYVYDTERFATYKDRWILAADSSIEYLASHPSSRPDLTFLAYYENQTLEYVSEHLACFDGGSFLLGGAVLKEQKYIDFGLALVDGCEDTYNQTLTGIGPEIFNWVVSDGSNTTSTTGVPADQVEFYERAGFYITNSDYILRPEVMESFYYAYRVTGDPKYQEYAWNAFLAINSTTAVGSGYSEISNVNAAGGGSFLDFQDSFFFAEVLKYSYLIHATDNVWDVEYEGANQFVFNTEAHPFKVFGPPI